jgi:hypothetical protein
MTLAVALHDVEPRSFERCKEIRSWLLERASGRNSITYDELLGHNGRQL